MQKPLKMNDYRRVKINSEYSGFDFFLIKKPLQSTLKIPNTILLDRYGSPKQWIFNSYKLPNHPILKKRKENLIPLIIIKNICSRFINYSSISHFKSIYELKQFVISTLNSRKDAEISSKKKNLEIRTVDGDILQINLIEFLQIICENKLADHNFYEKWKMIQERVSTSKLDQCYIVQSVRRNHIIQSKSSKFIAVSTGSKNNIPKDQNDPFKQSLPSKELEVTDTKTIEAYKFFDTYLNKKFFNAVQNFIECVQKNYKCIVESLITRFVIDSDRQPHLSSIEEIYVKPTSKLFQMKQFAQYVFQGEIKLENYVRCLQQFLIENPSKPEPNLHQPLSQQRRYRCRGQFCDAVLLSIPHYNESKFKLPLITTANTRKISSGIIESVKKRRSRVVQKLKQNKILDQNYYYEVQESSEFQDSEEETSTNVKVCQNCFIFYINVLKFFELDGFNNIIEKRSLSVRTKTITDQTIKKAERSVNDVESGAKLSRRLDYKSLKSLHVKTKVNSEEVQKIEIKRTASQQSKFRNVAQSPTQLRKSDEGIKQSKVQTKIKQPSIQKQPRQKTDSKTSKLIEAKLSNAKVQSGQSQVSPTKQQINSPKKQSKPTNYHQAAEQLLQKLQTLPSSNVEQFIKSSNLYYTNNLPQLVDRTYFSQEYLVHLYDFMNNSPIVSAPGNRIKKRPEMTLKRLSQLTNYPQIVSRSTFVFDTLICDQKTTIPFCVLSSKMIHNNNNPSKPYQNIFIINDIFDSFIQHICLSKELLEDSENTRIILFNYPGQSHTIYDKNLPFRTTQFCGILDKLIYRLSSEPNQLNIIGRNDTFKLIGLGYGGFLTTAFLSSCPALFPLVKGVILINSAYTLNQKYREVFQSLLQLYSVADPTTEQNAFLFYNKAINSTELSSQELQNKSGLNSIRLDGRCYLLENALNFWNDVNNQNFSDYGGKVSLVYSKGNILLPKSDMQVYLVKQDLDKTVLKNRTLVEIEGGHDIFAQHYDSLTKLLSEFIN